MEDEKILEMLNENYDLQFVSIEKIKNVYKINSNTKKIYCLKVINYNFPHFKFILSAILHLQKNGFKTIPEVIKTKEKCYYIKFFEKYAFLSNWVTSRQSNYDNPVDLSRVSEKLGELHSCSERFIVTMEMDPRIGWFSWINVFNTRKSEILDFKNRINQKAKKSNFDKLYLEHLEKEIEKADKSIKGLEKSNYKEIMKREIMKSGFCHHDYAHHNVLIDKSNNINIIDFDYCILDTHLHDLASLMIRAMKKGKWKNEKGNNIIKSYSKSNSLMQEEIVVINEFIRFPQEYWQLGIQKYWEQQPWSEESFFERLNNYVEDSEEKTKYIENFF